MSEVFGESIPVNQQIEEIASAHVFKNLLGMITLRGKWPHRQLQTHQVEHVPILEAIVQPHDPFRPSRRAHKGCRFQNITLGANVALLTLSQHIRLA